MIWLDVILGPYNMTFQVMGKTHISSGHLMELRRIQGGSRNRSPRRKERSSLIVPRRGVMGRLIFSW